MDNRMEGQPESIMLINTILLAPLTALFSIACIESFFLLFSSQMNVVEMLNTDAMFN